MKTEMEQEKTNNPKREDNNQGPFMNLLSSDNLNRAIKNLSNPKFLGSIHLKQKVDQNFSSVGRMDKSDTELKVNDSLKSVVFNPLTKLLVAGAITFNIIWFLLSFIL